MHQGGVVDAHGDIVQGPEQPGLGHRHVHQVLTLPGGQLRLVLVDPGALVADVGHLEQILVETGGAQHFLEDGLVGGGAAGRHHHPVQVVFPDLLHHLGLGVLGAGEEVGLGVLHVGKALGESTMAGTSATPPMLRPQLQTKTPTRGGSPATSCSGGKSFFFIRVPRAAARGLVAAAAAALPSITDWGMSLGPVKAPQA